MRKSLVVLSAAFLCAGAASAADPEPVPAAYDWSGFYAGVNAGYGCCGDDDVGIKRNGAFLGSPGNLEIDGFFGGGQIGYNLQSDQFVYGIEADAQLSGLEDSFDNGSLNLFSVDATSKVDAFGTVRGRLGIAQDNWLFYGTGGVAWGTTDYDVSGTSFLTSFRVRGNDTLWGYAVGAGVEYAVDEDWSVKFEYQYVNLGRETLSAVGADGAVYRTEQTPDFHSARVGINFHF